MSAVLRSGVSPQRAWRDALVRAALIDQSEGHDLSECEAGPPWPIRALATPVPRPSIVRMVRDMPATVRGLWNAERQRSRRDQLARAERGVRISDCVTADGHPAVPVFAPTLTAQWWRSRSAPGRLTTEVAHTLCMAMDMTMMVGGTPAEVLDRIAHGLDQQIAADNERRIARAGPRASARVLGLLPLMGLGGAALMGVDPLRFFSTSVAGFVVGCVGVVLMIAGAAVSHMMVRHAEQRASERHDIALLMDVAAGSLVAGSSVLTLIRACGQSLPDSGLEAVAHALVRGDPWWSAWGDVPEEFLPFARVLEPAWERGVNVVDALETHAQAQRRALRVSIAQENARLGVRLLLPLGLLQLPAFIALGVVPVIAHIAGATLG